MAKDKVRYVCYDCGHEPHVVTCPECGCKPAPIHPPPVPEAPQPACVCSGNNKCVRHAREERQKRGDMGFGADLPPASPSPAREHGLQSHCGIVSTCSCGCQFEDLPRFNAHLRAEVLREILELFGEPLEKMRKAVRDMSYRPGEWPALDRLITGLELLEGFRDQLGKE